MAMRWRLQLLAEEAVGTRQRQQQAIEESKVTKLKRATRAG